eukprot:s92_g29.t1
MGHLFCENRAVFAAGLVCIPTCVLQHILLTLDIMPGQLNFSLQRLGPFAQIVAWIAMAIEYQPYYDPGTAAIGYVLVYVTYAFHIIYTIQLLRICAPDFSAPDQAEVPQGTWWPGQWRLPKAFKHAVWLVGEMRKTSEGGTQTAGQPGRLTFDAVEAKRRDVHRALGKQGESPAWFNVRTGLLGLLVAWVYLVFGFTIEVANAHTTTPSFLSAGGMPNNLRDPRYRPPKVGAHEPTEVGTGGSSHGPAVGDIISSLPREELVAKIRSALPYLAQLAKGGGRPTAALEKSMIDTTTAMPQAKATAIRWPAMFEPRLMCGHVTTSKLLALSHHGRGLIITPETDAEPQQIALHGGNMGPLLAAHWDEHGLMLLASSGATFHCREAVDGLWPCQDSQLAPLPLGPGPFRGTVALSRAHADGDGAMHAAITFPKERSVAIFAHTGRGGDSWLPAGEVRTRAVATSSSFAAGGKDLLLTSADGAVEGGKVKLLAAPVVGGCGYILLAHHILLYLVMGGAVYYDASKHAQREGVEVYNPVVLSGVWEDVQSWGIQRWRDLQAIQVALQGLTPQDAMQTLQKASHAAGAIATQAAAAASSANTTGAAQPGSLPQAPMK